MSVRNVFVLLCSAIMSATLMAQTTQSSRAALDFPEAPSTITNVPQPMKAQSGQWISIQQRDEKSRVWNKEFTTWIIAANVATVVDFESTIHALKTHPGVQESSLLYGSHPTRARMYGIGIPMNAGIEFLSYYVKKNYSSSEDGWIWRIPTISLTLSHTAGAAANIARYH